MKAKHVILALATASLMYAQAHADNDVGDHRVSDAGAAQAVQYRVQENKATNAAHEALASQVFNKAGEHQVAVLSPEEMKETRGANISSHHIVSIRFPGYYGIDGRWHLWGSPFSTVPVDWSRGPYLLSM